MKFTKKAQAKVLIISILLIMLITILVISGTFYISLSSQKEIETYYDELLNVTCSEGECGTINVSLDPIVQDEGPSYIGEGGSSWKFDVEKLDELDADIEYLGDNIFKLIPKINNESKVSKPDYKWKMQVNYTENSIKQNIKVREEMEKKDIGKEIIFTIPEGIENFKISIGETSTVIDGSVVQTALAYGENDNMCRDSNGMMHVSYIGDGEDLFYANSSDGGTWTTKELQSLITVHRTGITCDSEDNILVYYSDSDYVKMYNSSDGGVTFPTSYTIADTALDLEKVDCAVGSDDVTHCCMIDEDDQLEYANTSRLDYTTVISVADSDHCAIEIDNDNNIVIVVSETDTDDLDYMKRTDGSWGSRTTIAESLGTVSVANGAGISIAIDSENEWHISGTFGIDLQYCNGSDASFTCQEVDSSTSYNSNIASTENGEIYIFYASASSTDDGDVYRANSTDGVTWSTRVQVPSESSSGFPSIAHSNYPSWNNIFDTLHFVYVTQADVYYDNFSVDFPIYGLWTCDTDEDFSNASCWSYGVVPTAGIDVVFNSGGTGDCNITNGTMPQDLGSFLVDTDYGGTIYFNPLFAVGDWTGNNDGTQLWNVTNNINVSGGTMKIYGDYLHSAFTGVEGNITEDGHGQEWRSVSGDVIVGSGAVLDGIGLGFPIGIGQGYSTTGGTYGGRGNTNNVDPYGNAIAPTSLGGSSDVYAGSSAIKLHANNIVNVEGNILVDGNGAWNQEGSSGGSIWLEGNSIIVIGSLNASGGNGRYHPGGGGRIRLEYGSNMNYTGYIGLKGGKSSVYPGTLTFTNNTWPGDWNIKGTVGLLGGDYGEGEVVNILGNFNSGGDIFIYGDCFSIRAVPKDYVCYNTTNVGQGVWINASGNITLNSGDMIDGIGLGFYIETGPGYASSDVGVSHGGRGAANTGPAVYGSETQPTSLGSGASFKYQGGSAVKLQTNEIINIIGNINMNGLGGLAGYLGPSGGSIYLISDNITISGDLSSEGSSGYYGSGGGGRIALYGDKISLSGNINNNGGLRTSYGGGGTVYINASTSITSSGNIITRGYDGGNITFNDTLLTLSGTYNATGTNSNANITLDYTDCSSDYSGGTFDPVPINLSGCTADTCTCPSVDTNWEVNMEDYCNLTTSCNIGLGNLSWIGSFGYFNCSSELNLSNRNTPISSTIFYYYNGCQVNRL